LNRKFAVIEIIPQHTTISQTLSCVSCLGVRYLAALTNYGGRRCKIENNVTFT